MAKRRAIVSVTNDLLTDNRVDKVCLFLQEQGYAVTLVGRKRANSLPLSPRSYRTKRLKLFYEKGALFYAEYNFRLFWFLLFKRCDLLLANDLDTLLANYTASKFKPMTRLVYDSHEYFTHVPELIHRPRTQKIWEAIEGWIFPKLHTVYTVNTSIATIYREKYKKTVKIVRNASPYWRPKSILSKKELGIPENKFLIILQGAGINVDRGAEEAVEAMKQIDGAVLMIVGDGDVVETLQQTVAANHLSEKVLFFGKRPYTEMMHFTHHADVGLTLDKPSNPNYSFSLPNKVFDYIHAETPIIATNLVEIRTLIERHEIGSILPHFTPDTLATQLISLKENPEKLALLKSNCKTAATVENWESEKITLAEIYPKS
jgi:glycosyltransferase involved in cell wall biosynthesis